MTVASTKTSVRPTQEVRESRIIHFTKHNIFFAQVLNIQFFTKFPKVRIRNPTIHACCMAISSLILCGTKRSDNSYMGYFSNMYFRTLKWADQVAFESLKYLGCSILKSSQVPEFEPRKHELIEILFTCLLL